MDVIITIMALEELVFNSCYLPNGIIWNTLFLFRSMSVIATMLLKL